MERSTDPKIVALRAEMYRAIEAAQKAAYAYWTECDVGDERFWASDVYQNLMHATRTF